MRRLLVLLVLVVPLPALAQQPGKADPQTKRSIEKLEHAWVNAYLQRDSATLARIEAPEFKVINGDGSVSTKAEDISGVVSGKVHFESADFDDLEVRRYGGTAIASSHVKIRGQAQGKDISGDYRSTDVFAQRNGRWVAVFSQGTPVAK